MVVEYLVTNNDVLFSFGYTCYAFIYLCFWFHAMTFNACLCWVKYYGYK